MNDGIKKVLPKLMIGILAVLLAVSAIVGYQFYMEMSYWTRCWENTIFGIYTRGNVVKLGHIN